MRSSRVSRETARLVEALSSTNNRQTRSNSRAKTQLTNANTARPTSKLKNEPKIDNGDASDSSGLSTANTTDIEDLLTSPSKKRKRDFESPVTKTAGANGFVKSQSISPGISTATRRSPRKVIIKEESPKIKPKPNPKPRKLPARKTTDSNGTVTTTPPSNWETIYDTVKEMRRLNPTAPVDTMGCAELYWRSSSLRDRRFQTLIALMLSSQTKDTVTAVAMQRLHTELVDINDAGISAETNSSEDKTPEEKAWDHTRQSNPSTLTVENILAVPHTRLNELIRTVGFHNNKTKYIKASALILRDEYDSDIPTTIEGLMRLPGVGPKMAYLCMSAAWNRHEGIGVDVHVHRITNMWGWHTTKTPEATRAALEAWLPKDKWHEINKLLVGLGQTVCSPVGKKCGQCDLAGTGLCKGEIKGGGISKKKVKVKSVKEEDPPVKEEMKVDIKIEEDL